MAQAASATMNRQQARVFAQGLFHLAGVDGIDEREIRLIRDFLYDVGHPDLFDQVRASGFDVAAAAQTLDTTFVRRMFLRTAVALVGADGVLSQSERATLGGMARGFDLEDQLEELLADRPGKIQE